jgi:hypothetical protein
MSLGITFRILPAAPHDKMNVMHVNWTVLSIGGLLSKLLFHTQLSFLWPCPLETRFLDLHFRAMIHFSYHHHCLLLLDLLLQQSDVRWMT